MENSKPEMAKEGCQPSTASSKQEVKNENVKVDGEMYAYNGNNEFLLDPYKLSLNIISDGYQIEKENYQPSITDSQYELADEPNTDLEMCMYKTNILLSELYKTSTEVNSGEFEMEEKNYQLSTNPLHELASEKEKNVGETCEFKQSTQVLADPSFISNKKTKSSSAKNFHCAKCSYSTKHKSTLISHMMVHKDPSETTMYKCDFCEHETKRKADIRAHMIIHKDPAEVKLFYCANCPYTTKRKCDLKQHVIIHLTTPYKCPLCNFETKNKQYLDKQHMLLHKDESEIEVYKCELCLYETKTKVKLKMHYSNIHDSNRIKKYACNWCDFKTKYKINLKEHMLVHTCPSELEMFECHTCGFQTKRKSGIKDHIWANHMVVEEKYQCAHCPFKTRVRASLRAHLVRHRDPSRIRYYHCDLCDYKGTRKGNVKAHMVTHSKNPNKAAPAAVKIESIDQLKDFVKSE